MTPTPRRAAIYVRVSTNKQHTENQELVLREVCQRAGWGVAAVYEDKGFSGSKGRDKRPALDGMLKDATRRRFDIVLAFKLDRLARSVKHLIDITDELKAARVDLYLHDQGVDTSTPAGQLFLHMLAAIAQFERSILIERIEAGLERARGKGVKLGRRPSIPEEKREAIRADLVAGKGIKSAAKAHGVGVLTVQNIKKELTQ
jgi:DNA invertase Pin-like site-specific DNA recombinase